MKERITFDDLARAIARAESGVRDSGYLAAVACECGWRGRFIEMRSPKTYPGRARCPDCASERWSTEPLKGE